MQIEDIFWLGLLVSIALYWWHAQGCKHRALFLVKQHCLKMQVQLLDDSVALTRLRLKRINGQLKWQRSYQFEFSSTYDDRYTGNIVLLGFRLETIELGIYRI